MAEAECRDVKDAMSAPRPHKRQDENQTADSSPPLLSTNNAACGLTPPRSSSDGDQKQSGSTISVVTDFLAGPSSPSNWLRLKLSPTERDELEQRLPDEKFRGFRRDYFLATRTFSVGMETKIHAAVNAKIAFTISLRLWQLASQNPDSAIGQFAAKIVNESGATIPLSELPTKNSHRPDISFIHEDARLASIVIEVAHSQPKEDLEDLAEEYILGSTSRVRCVYGIKIAYRSGKQAWLSAWEPNLDTLADGTKELSVEQTVEDQMFRTADGLPNLGCRGICLSLTLLAPTNELARELAEVPNDLGQIRITAEELCRFLDTAERVEVNATKGVDRDMGPGEVRVKRRERAALEEVSGDRLKKFEDEEGRVALRYEKEDLDYLG